MSLKRTVAVVCSGRVEHLQVSLSCALNQTVPLAAIIVVAWGAKANAIMEVASGLDHVSVIEGLGSGATSIQRNIGFKRASSLMPDYVASIDDDTFLHEAWHEHVLRTAEHADRCSIGSIVAFTSNPKRIQGCGHTLAEFRPLDIAYGATTEADMTASVAVAQDIFSCPCANCAFIPWNVLEKIYALEGSYWDERFPRLACFELGFKMHRLGYGYVVSPGAFATHDGYLHRQNLQRESVRDQLFSRILLYKKFLPESERLLAFSDLQRRVLRWASHQYPHSHVSGQDVVRAYRDALLASQQFEFESLWTSSVDR